jgi:hypothetical protein
MFMGESDSDGSLDRQKPVCDWMIGLGAIFSQGKNAPSILARNPLIPDYFRNHAILKNCGKHLEFLWIEGPFGL